MIKIEQNIENTIKNMLGKGCCRKRVGRMNSLSLGFGEKIFHGKNNLPDSYYGEWEIGTYIASWRIMHAGKIICGSNDEVDSFCELHEKLEKIAIGRITNIFLITEYDIRVEFENEICVDVMPASSEDDEYFHVFCPANLYVERSIVGGWKIGKSNEPW